MPDFDVSLLPGNDILVIDMLLVPERHHTTLQMAVRLVAGRHNYALQIACLCNGWRTEREEELKSK